MHMNSTTCKNLHLIKTPWEFMSCTIAMISTSVECMCPGSVVPHCICFSLKYWWQSLPNIYIIILGVIEVLALFIINNSQTLQFALSPQYHHWFMLLSLWRRKWTHFLRKDSCAQSCEFRPLSCHLISAHFLFSLL